MRIVMFYHSLVSDWNHGNAHFLRGIVAELMARGHDVTVYETRDGWSRANLLKECGEQALDAFKQAYPGMQSELYGIDTFDPNPILESADLVLVHEWTDRRVIESIGRHHRKHREYRLLFHDTHHRSVTSHDALSRIDLSAFDGVLAFGSVICDKYLQRGWAERAWTWHEAADTRVFSPLPQAMQSGALSWIGNWGDDERAAELHEFLIEPIRALRVNATVNGVRYPEDARRSLDDAGIRYGGYIPNFKVPRVLNSHCLTLHIPRRPYTRMLPGIPTIRVFEALACAVPLLCSPWDDIDGLFTPGEDYLVASDGAMMTQYIAALLDDPDAAARIGAHGRETVLARHTCAHRVDELMAICRELGLDTRSAAKREMYQAPRHSASASTVVLNGSSEKQRHDSMNPRAQGRAARTLDIAFFGSSLVSSYWNGAATYYRGIIRAMAELGNHITFYEPDVLDRQKHRDIPDPPWSDVVVYQAGSEQEVLDAVSLARGADVVVKASGVGAFDELLEREILALQTKVRRAVFWDVDAPATLARIAGSAGDPLRRLIPKYDAIFTYGGGDAVVKAYEALGARVCVPVYNALDPTTHFPVPADTTLQCDLVFLGNRLPDREARVEEFFFKVAEVLPDRSFLLGGSGWEGRALPPNVRLLGHLSTSLHNSLNCSATAVLNISRQSMAAIGFSPATRVFEAAGAGACIITDAWEGIEVFLEPGKEILVASDGDQVRSLLEKLDRDRARAIGSAARRRILRDHTYTKRAAQAIDVLSRGLHRSTGQAMQAAEAPS